MTTALPLIPRDDTDLRVRALDFYQYQRPALFAQLKRDNALLAAITRKVKACKEYAQNLMEAGSTPEEAWNRAIRLQILESESD